MNNKPIYRREWLLLAFFVLVLLVELVVIFHPKDQTAPVVECTFSTPC